VAWFVTPRVRFLHVPKTGGSWATDAMCAAGVPAVHPEPSPIHAILADSREYEDRFTFAFVRHPLEYWRSYWAYRVRTGWNPEHKLDRAAASDKFDEFIEGVIAIDPGGASSLFEHFVGPAENEISFVGRHERLVDDVCQALRIAGETFDEHTLRSYPRVNASDYVSTRALYSRSLAERLAAVEQAAIDRFYPWEPIPQRLLVDKKAPRLRDPTAARLADTLLELRDARAALEVARRDAHRCSVELESASSDLEAVRSSRLMRLTRLPRRWWYRTRRSLSAR
jgi:hypothetical protein